MPGGVQLKEGRALTQRRAKHTDQYGLAVLLVVLTMIIIALPSTSWWNRLLALVLEGGTLLFILWTSAVRQRTLAIMSVVVVGAIVAAGISVLRGGAFAAGAVAGVGALLALFAPAAIVRHLLAELRITASTVLGALCLYLIAGIFFSYVFAVVNATDQGHFFVQTTHPADVDYLYFSLVTLTTLGYGDLTASGSLGKMLAVTEALAGQLYLVSVVAVLVSNIGRPRRRHADEGGGPSGEDTGA